MEWGGLRGALSMVLALSIPDEVGFKEVIVTLVFGVVLLSIFLQGLSMTPLLRMLGIVSSKSQVEEYEELKARVSMLENTLDRLDKLRKRRMLSAKSADALKKEYQQMLDEANARLDALEVEHEALVKEETLRFKRRAIMEQKEHLLELYQNGSLSPEVYHHLREELDTQLLSLENMSL